MRAPLFIMTTQEPGPGSDPNVERAMDEFRARWIEGERPSPAEFRAAHPECGPDLDVALEKFLVVAKGLQSLAEAAEISEVSATGRLGDFRLIREIGRGGMGVVYEAEQIPLHRSVALKVLPAHVTLRSSTVKRFHREASTVARLRHEGIVEVHAVGEEDRAHYFAMSFVEGAPLDSVIEMLGRMPLDGLDGTRLRETVETTAHRRTEGLGGEESIAAGHVEVWDESYVRAVVRIVRQVAEALEYAHRAGVVHRDVKPSNILVRPDGTAVLTDFGIARDEGLPTLTLTGQFAGTPQYVAPEQAEADRHRADARSDVFSLGATLYEFLTLHRPFEASSSPSVLDKILSTEGPVSPRRANRRVPRDLETICLTALEKLPERRYQTAGEMAADLRRFLDHRPVQARPVGFVVRSLRAIRRKPLRSVAGAAFVLLLAVFLISREVSSRHLDREHRTAIEQRELLARTLEFMVTGFGFAAAHPAGTLEPNASRMAPVARGETITALLLARQAIDAIALVDGGDERARALLCSTMGTICRLLGMYGESEDLLAEALSIYQELPDPDPVAIADCHHRIAILHHDLMVQEGRTVEFYKVQFELAAAAFDKALERLRSGARAESATEARARQRSELSVLHNIGVLNLDRRGYQVKRATFALHEDPGRVPVLREDILRCEKIAEENLLHVLEVRRGFEVPHREALAATLHQLTILYHERARFPRNLLAMDAETEQGGFEEAEEMAVEALAHTAPTYLDVFGNARPHPDYRPRALLLAAIRDHLDSRSPQETADVAALPLDLDLPAIYFVAHRPGEPGRPPENLLARFDHRRPGQNEQLWVAPARERPVFLELSPSVSRGRLCFLRKLGEESETEILVLDAAAKSPPRGVVVIPSMHVRAPVWHPRDDKIYFCWRQQGTQAEDWATLDKGEGIYWVDARPEVDATPRPLLHRQNQEFYGLSISPVAPFDEVAFLHYPWHHGASARDLWIADLNEDGTRVTGQRKLLGDNLADTWCAFTADGAAIFLQQSFTIDKFGGAGRRSISRVAPGDSALAEESLLRIGHTIARPSVSSTGFMVSGHGGVDFQGLVVFDEEWNRIGVIRGEDVGLPGYLLTMPAFAY